MMTLSTGSSHQTDSRLKTQDSRLTTKRGGETWVLGLGSRRGFTLIELLVSVVILASGAVLVMQGLAKAAQATLVTDQHEWAYLFALSKMADVELAARAGKELPEREAGTFQRDGQAFEWEVVTSAMDDPLVKDVTLTVSWRAGSQAYDRRFETLLRTPAPAPGG